MEKNQIKTPKNELEKAIKLSHYKKAIKIVDSFVAAKDSSVLPFFYEVITSVIADGLTSAALTKGYIRIKRQNDNDISPIYDLWDSQDPNVISAVMDVLGYDKVVPTLEEQKELIDKFFHYGDDWNLRGISDPRYGLAAACAGWNPEIARPFLLHCLNFDDAPLKYVAMNSLNRKYVRLRWISKRCITNRRKMGLNNSHLLRAGKS